MNVGKKRAVAVAGVVLLALGVALWAGVGRPESARGQGTDSSSGQAIGITVTGVGKVSGQPDRADFTFGVETQGKTADEALAANSVAAQKVIDAVKGAGVAATDIQTAQVSVYPRYSDDGQTIVGFSASNSVTAKIRDISKAGAVVEAAVNAGANQVYGPTFSISDETTLYKGAMDEAFADARSKAEALADIAGVTLGRVVNVVESGGYYPIATRDAAEAGDSSVPIEPGLQEIQASLTVTFAIS